MNEIDEELNRSEQSAEYGFVNPEEDNSARFDESGAELDENGENNENGEDDEEKAEPSKPFSDALEWVSSIVFAVSAMLVLNLFFLRSITVSGPSMLDTLENGDQVVATNFCYTPAVGDIVIIQANKLMNDDTDMWGEPIIKRVIAVEGDTISIDFSKGEVYRNGELLEEDYIKDLTFFRYDDTWMESGREYTVPENCVFVLGDNRPVSNDSRNLRQVGFIDTDLIMGKAFVRVAPFDKFKWLSVNE